MNVNLSRWRSRLVAVLVLTLLAFFLWYGFFHTSEVIETEPVHRASIENTVSALGVLQPHRYVDVGAQVSGQVKHIAAQVGGTVKKGELLLEIDPALQQATVSANRATLSGLRAQLTEQEAEHDHARQQAERQRRMVADGATRQEEVDAAEANLRITAARVNNLKAQIEGAQSVLEGNEALLGYTRIYAPIDGTVVTLDAREGQTLNATYQTPNLLRIADLSRMTVWTEVSEADVGRIRVGMSVYFTTLGLQDEAGRPRRWQGKLAQVLPAPPTEPSTSSSTSSATTGKVVLYTALFDVENADGTLMPQMSAQVFFVIAHAENVVVAPFAALTPTTEANVFTARVLVGGKVEARNVKIGTRDRLNGEVLAGLKEGEALVTGVRRETTAGRVRW
ncbi:MAG: efflux RND transporter periplasmic adaptor subunit [Candidatus Accumulibacter sp.]|jgi:macrolide-specific efflux system membrane fusion protein|nr:efflux RND transporter periplasmic adaptor subunit [Accumulibacter sp.]